MNNAQPPTYGSDRLSRSASFWLLDCAETKGWYPRGAEAGLRTAHPGTAVDWNDRLYEVISAEPLSGGGIRYKLTDWDEAQAIRSYQRYDPESEAARKANSLGARRREILRRYLILLSPLAGHLPASVQRRLHHEYGISLTLPTISSAIPLLLASFLVLFLFPSSPYPLTAKVLLEMAAAYLYLESSIRLANACLNVQPMGSLAGLLAYRLFR